ncbi:MAG: hypothetical protein GY927_18920 [bacterium]|nr:hypothetical protein [bacterium]
MAKRTSITGKGADVFFLDKEEARKQSEEQDMTVTPVRIKPVKVTIYLPPDLASQLDQAWLRRKLKSKKETKSHIVSEALKPFLKKELSESD